MKTIYIAGNMSSHAGTDFGRAQFAAKQKELEEAGWKVINPVELDDAAGEDFVSQGLDAYGYVRCARRDFDALDDCDAIYMLHGWDGEVWSKGACWELAYMKKLGKEIFYETPRADGGEPKSISYADMFRNMYQSLFPIESQPYNPDVPHCGIDVIFGDCYSPNPGHEPRPETEPGVQHERKDSGDKITWFDPDKLGRDDRSDGLDWFD